MGPRSAAIVSGRNGPPSLLAVDARRWVLHKQHLVRAGQRAGVAAVASDLIGLHATDPLTPYLSLLARIPGFEAGLLDHELYETHGVVRIPAMRNTLFLVARPQVATVIAATRSAGVRTSWQYFAGRLSREQYQQAAPQILAALRGHEATVRELKRSLDLDCDVSATVKLLCDEAVLVRAHPAGGPRAAQHAYALMSQWLPDLDLAAAGEEGEALARLVAAYVQAYGPVGEADIAWWTGSPRRGVRAAIAALGGALATVTVEGSDSEMLMQRDDLAALRGAAAMEPAGLVLLPELDPYTQGYAHRGRYLDAGHAPWVLDRKGNVTSTVLLDGRVVGVWDLTERPAAEIRLHLLAPLDKGQRDALNALAERTARFVLGTPAPAVEYRTMIPLTERAGWVRSPLEGASDARPLPS